MECSTVADHTPVTSVTITSVNLAASAAVAAAALTAYVLTGSAACLAAGALAVANGSSQMLIVSRQMGGGRARPASDGPDRDLFFWCLVVGMLPISLAAGIAVYTGSAALSSARSVESPDAAVVVLGLGLFATVFSAWSTLQAFNVRPNRIAAADPAGFALAVQSTAAVAGVALALGGVIVGQRLQVSAADGAAAVGIGLVLAAVAATLAIETRRFITEPSGAASPGAASPAQREVAAGATSPLDPTSGPERDPLPQTAPDQRKQAPTAARSALHPGAPGGQTLSRKERKKGKRHNR